MEGGVSMVSKGVSPPPRKSILDKILFTPLYNILINRLVKHQKCNLKASKAKKQIFDDFKKY